MSTHIKRIDLTRDYNAHREEYLEAIERVCRDTAFSGGKYADAFDREFAEYVGVPYACGVNNGTSALHLAMLALGVGPGDEVIVPANTYIATAWGVSYTGATPVFVDCTADTWELDTSLLAERITPRTRGILGVHLYGQPFDYAGARAVADRHGLFVAEDCAQAHGAKFEGRNVGALGDIACFSFYPGKNLFSPHQQIIPIYRPAAGIIVFLPVPQDDAFRSTQPRWSGTPFCSSVPLMSVQPSNPLEQQVYRAKLGDHDIRIIVQRLFQNLSSYENQSVSVLVFRCFPHPFQQRPLFPVTIRHDELCMVQHDLCVFDSADAFTVDFLSRPHRICNDARTAALLQTLVQ